MGDSSLESFHLWRNGPTEIRFHPQNLVSQRRVSTNGFRRQRQQWRRRRRRCCRRRRRCCDVGGSSAIKATLSSSIVTQFQTGQTTKHTEPAKMKFFVSSFKTFHRILDLNLKFLKQPLLEDTLTNTSARQKEHNCCSSSLECYIEY